MPISFWESLSEKELDELSNSDLMEAYRDTLADAEEITRQLADRGERISERGDDAPAGERQWLKRARGAFAGKRGRLKKLAFRMRARGLDVPDMPTVPAASPVTRFEPQPVGRRAADVLTDILEELYRWDIDPARRLADLMREAEAHRVTVA